MSLLRLLALTCVCGSVLAQTDEGYTDYDVSIWQRAPDVIGPPLGQSDQDFTTLRSDDVELTGVVDTIETAANCVCVLTYLCDEDKWLNNAYEDTHGTMAEGGEWNVQQCTDELMWCCKIPGGAAPAPEAPPTDNHHEGIAPTQMRPNTTKCGVQKAGVVDNTSLRIRFGDETELGEFPWMLALISVVTMSDGKDLTVFACGASLIHSQVALTAAHCIAIARKNYPQVKFRVRAGDWDISSAEEIIAHQELDVAKVIMRQGFKKATMVNDIAILVLAQPVREAANVGTVCLPQPGEQTFPRGNCWATGWGRGTIDSNAGAYETILHKVELEITPTLTCQAELRKIRCDSNYKLNPSFLCATGKDGRDTCKGDGGGPLVCLSPLSSDHFVQVGIVSWGIGCGNGTPGVYTDVANQRAWIDDILLKEGFYAESDQ